jgi:hypothetical protein
VVGASCDSVAVEPPCNPEVDPLCVFKLRSADSLSIVKALQKRRPQQDFADPNDWAVCSELFARFEALLAQGHVLMGRNVPGDNHSGLQHGNKIHFDKDYLNQINANRSAGNLADLLGLALHEAAHTILLAGGARKYDHDESAVPGTYPFPFNLTSPITVNAIPNSCAKP